MGMTITLSPELETVVRQQVEAGRYESAVDCVADAIKTFDSQRKWLDAQRDKIEAGWQESERDEVISAEELMENMKAWKTESMGLQKTA